MDQKRKIEIFSAGCSVCEEAISLVNRLACPSCKVTVLDMKRTDMSIKALNIGIRSVPAVVIDGQLANCCDRGLNEEILKSAGLGLAIESL